MRKILYTLLPRDRGSIKECRSFLFPNEIKSRTLIHAEFNKLPFEIQLLVPLCHIGGSQFCFCYFGSTATSRVLIFTSANTVVGGAVYEVSGGISSYFHLKSVNEDLLDRNMLLEEQINNLEKR